MEYYILKKDYLMDHVDKNGNPTIERDLYELKHMLNTFKFGSDKPKEKCINAINILQSRLRRYKIEKIMNRIND
jgi:hypothetical protein